MPNIEPRKLLGSFETRREALLEARTFTQMSGLDSEVVGEEPECRVVIDSAGPSPSIEWHQHVFVEEEAEDEPEDEPEDELDDETDEETDEETDDDLSKTRRDFLLGRSKDGDHLAIKKYHRLFTENLKHPNHFVERLGSSQFLLLFDTFPIGNKRGRMLLDLGRLTAFALHHMSGASPRVALLSALRALAMSNVEVQFRKINLGPIQSPSKGRTLVTMDPDLWEEIAAVSTGQFRNESAYETYRGAFYELRRRGGQGFVFLDRCEWVVAIAEVSVNRRCDLTESEEFQEFAHASQRAISLAANCGEQVTVRRSENGWTVLFLDVSTDNSEQARAPEWEDVSDADEEDFYEMPSYDDDDEREMLVNEAYDYADGASRSDDEGWFYPDEKD